MNFQLLPYPLNVYAQTLVLEYGEVEHLHFGVFTDGGDSYPVAQHKAQSLLQEMLLPAPATVLEVGSGTGALARTLSTRGYAVTALTDIAAEAAALQEQGTPCIHEAFDRHEPAATVDILILQHSAQYFDPMVLFAKANACLNEGGQLLIADEFVLDDSERQHETRPLLQHFLQLAVRCGFQLVAQRQFGAEVACGLEKFQTLLCRHQKDLCAGLSISPLLVQRLIEGLVAQQRQFAEGRLGYILLDLRRGPVNASAPVFVNIHSLAMKEIGPLFEDSFNGPFDDSVWRWKYGDGRGKAVGARVNGRLVAHYGGAPRDILYFGRRDKAIQICDVMVMTVHRSFANRETLFFRTAATFLEQHVGNAAEHLLGFGFPNERVLRVATRLGLYDVTDRFIEIHYPPLAHEVAGCDVVDFELESVSSRPQVDALWESMAAGLQQQIVGIRDWAYLYYRYCTHPLWSSGGYWCLALRRSGAQDLSAIVVLKKHDNAVLLMDIIGAVEEFPLLLSALVARVAQTGNTLSCRITQGQAARLSLPGCEQRDLHIDIPCNRWTRGPGAQELAGAWWLTAGDMDFF